MSNEANAYVKPVYEEWMSDDDIALYEHLVSLGRVQLGKELLKNEDYLLHYSAMITLKQKKGMMLDINDEDIVRLKKIHQEHLEAGLIHTTPPNEWYYSDANPINQPYIPTSVQEDINKIEASTSNLNIENETADDIKEGYVKLVPVVEERSS